MADNELHFPRRIRTRCPDDPIIRSVENALQRIDAVRGTADWVPEWGIVEKHLRAAQERRDGAALAVARAVLVEGLRETGWLVGD
jgi:hypothetical protein